MLQKLRGNNFVQMALSGQLAAKQRRQQKFSNMVGDGSNLGVGDWGNPLFTL